MADGLCVPPSGTQGIRFLLSAYASIDSLVTNAAFQMAQSQGLEDITTEHFDRAMRTATTKGAIVTFTRGLAGNLAERGIRVNAVAPGPV